MKCRRNSYQYLVCGKIYICLRITVHHNIPLTITLLLEIPQQSEQVLTLGFEVFTVLLLLKIQMFWDVMLQ